MLDLLDVDVPIEPRTQPAQLIPQREDRPAQKQISGKERCDYCAAHSLPVGTYPAGSFCRQQYPDP